MALTYPYGTPYATLILLLAVCPAGADECKVAKLRRWEAVSELILRPLLRPGHRPGPKALDVQTWSFSILFRV